MVTLGTRVDTFRRNGRDGGCSGRRQKDARRPRCTSLGPHWLAHCAPHSLPHRLHCQFHHLRQTPDAQWQARLGPRGETAAETDEKCDGRGARSPRDITDIQIRLQMAVGGRPRHTGRGCSGQYYAGIAVPFRALVARATRRGKRASIVAVHRHPLTR